VQPLDEHPALLSSGFSVAGSWPEVLWAIDSMLPALVLGAAKVTVPPLICALQVSRVPSWFSATRSRAVAVDVTDRDRPTGMHSDVAEVVRSLQLDPRISIRLDLVFGERLVV
jgi:hypothetical protein